MDFVQGIASLFRGMGLSYEGVSVLAFFLTLLIAILLVCFVLYIVFVRNRANDALQLAKAQWRNDLSAAMVQTAERLIHQLSDSVRQSEMAITQIIGQNEGLSRQTMIDTLSTLQNQLSGQIDRTENGFRTFAQDQLDRTDKLTEKLASKIEFVGSRVDANLESIRQGNEAKLEKIRETVEDKLQSGLQQRVAESFRLVSQRLDEVYSGLGEMKRLASDVGTLKQVMVNVKSRGILGEVQLEHLLSDYFTADQYGKNVHPIPNQPRLVVEFAVKMPGRDGSGCWLPIDSKFPIEDFHRLQEQQESGNREALAQARESLRKRIVAEGREISKYIHSPETTDFAIMFLPSESLYAEVLSLEGIAEKLYSESRVYIMGPTTLASALCAYRAGFQSLAIEKRSSDVRELLAGVKTEFAKFGETLRKLKTQLDAASETVDKVESRTRQMNRRLSGLDGTAPDVPQELVPTTNQKQAQLEFSSLD